MILGTAPDNKSDAGFGYPPQGFERPQQWPSGAAGHE
jgi:hypothetical protein